MKKVMLFVAVVAAFSFASCKKDRTCTCKYDTGTPNAGTTAFTYTIKSTKSKAKSLCDFYNVAGSYTCTVD